MLNYNFKRILFIVQLATFAVLVGRGYQFIFWDAPYRALFFDEALLSPIINLTGSSWKDVVTNLEYDKAIEQFIRINGYFYLLSAAIVFLYDRVGVQWRKLLLLASVNLVILSILYCKEQFNTPAQFFEHSLQFGSPVLLYYLLRYKQADNRWQWLAVIFIALTFCSHGLYAINLYPIPVEFTNMTMAILHCDESFARIFLMTVGIIDVVGSIVIFMQNKFSSAMLLWFSLWGFLTLFARLWANWDVQNMGAVLHQYFFEAVLRLPHALIPLALYYSRCAGSTFLQRG
ncbi:MAG: hypothetical protein WAS72_05065 [Saprospiraceae bacterium]